MKKLGKELKILGRYDTILPTISSSYYPHSGTGSFDYRPKRGCMAGVEGRRQEFSSRNWDDRQLLNIMDSVLRRFYRSYWNLDPVTRSQVDRLRAAAAAAAGDADISALERRGILTGFLDDLATIEAVLPLVEEALRGGIASNNPGYGRVMGVSYLQALNLLRTMRDDPANYVPRSFQVPPAPALRGAAPPSSGSSGEWQTGGAARRGGFPGRQNAAEPATGVADGGAVVQFHTYVDFPPTISNRNDVKYPLVVQLVRDLPRESRGQTEVGIAFQNEVEYVDVVVRAPGFEEVSGYGAGSREGPALRRTITVPQDGDSQPAVFLFQLVDDRTGPQWVTVDFYHRGRNAGSLTLEVAVRGFSFLRGGTRRGEGIGAEEDEELPAFGTASVIRAVDGVTIPQGTPIPAADIELRITRDADGRTLHFHLHSQKLSDVDGRNVGSIVFNDLSRPDLFFDRLAERLSALAARAGTDLPGDEATRMEDEVADLGIELYEQLFPAPLRELYWEIKARRDAGELDNLLVVSDEPWIPWELVKPYDVVDGQDVEDDHLAGAWRMSRWLAGAAVPSDLNIRAARLVAPMISLDFVTQEIQYFDSLAARQIEIAPPITTRAQFLELAERGGAQLFHFATHGNYNQEFVDESPIVLEGDPLFPSDLTRRRARGLRREKPLIFLNTCHGARVGYNLTGLGGWAQRLVDHLGVTAFVGALWEVHDELASKFAQIFYEELWAGKTMGEAFHSARQQIRAMQAANPTWLAYTLYGDPNSRVSWQPEGR